MSFIKRLYYYSSGFIIGIIFLIFIFNGKKASCNYGPSARVINNIITKELIVHSNTLNYDNDKIINLILSGKVIFSKSDPNRDPCGIYHIESENITMIVSNCKNKANVEFK
tara:strand:- start:377 stop:709 length:333 start_codon:yes stop_codon:yes gene_type:complete